MAHLLGCQVLGRDYCPRRLLAKPPEAGAHCQQHAARGKVRQESTSIDRRLLFRPCQPGRPQQRAVALKDVFASPSFDRIASLCRTPSLLFHQGHPQQQKDSDCCMSIIATRCCRRWGCAARGRSRASARASCCWVRYPSPTSPRTLKLLELLNYIAACKHVSRALLCCEQISGDCDFLAIPALIGSCLFLAGHHVLDFWSAICICHSLIVEGDAASGAFRYQGPSPDEVCHTAQ